MNHNSSFVDINEFKLEIIHLTSACLIREPKIAATSQNEEKEQKRDGNSKDPREQVLDRIRFLVHQISDQDGEYVLKLALYLRHQLNLRTLPNYLMALCARELPCLSTLECYLEKLLVLPSDWLAVANFSYFYDSDALHVFEPSGSTRPCDSSSSLCRRYIPKALREALKKTFVAFDEFALGKYNNEKAEKKRRSKNATADRDTFTLKELIRFLHIRSPAYNVCCILGKRYPLTEAEFSAMGLDDGKYRFDAARAGKRMALATPLTWERALSARGNTAEVWDDLFQRNAVPFMAALRNLRNILLRCCSEKTHASLVFRLRSEEEVAQSRQFPYRFYSAREAVLGARTIVQKAAMRLEKANQSKRRVKVKRGVVNRTIPTVWTSCLKTRQDELLEALDAAVGISTKLNIPPMKGRSVVIFSLFPGLLRPMGGEAKGKKTMVSRRTQLDAIALLVSMMYRACEHCVVLLHCLKEHRLYTPRWLDGEKELSVLLRTEDLVQHCSQFIAEMSDAHPEWKADTQEKRYELGQFPFAFLDQLVTEHQTIESIVVLDEGHHTYSCMNADAPSFGDLPAYLDRLRRSSSPHLVFAGISVAGFAPQRSSESYLKSRFNHRNDFLLSGFSDAILKLIAERTGGGPKDIVERADVTYQVQKTSSRLTNEALQKKRKMISLIQKMEETHFIPTRLQALTSPSKDPSAKDSASAVHESGMESFGVSDSVDGPQPHFVPGDFSHGSVDDQLTNHLYERSELPELPTLSGAPVKAGVSGRESTAAALPPASPVVHTTTRRGLERQQSASLFATAAPSVHRRFLSSYRVWRFFISSTFLDMNNERNALTLDVFPRLRRWISERGLKVSLMEVDLRWGITQEASLKNLSTSVCLNEVVRCSPFFIGILGSRYGHVPNPLQVFPDDDISVHDFDWLQKRELHEKCSVTELEIKQGIFSALKRSEPSEPSNSVFFFVRDEDYLQQSLRNVSHQEVYAPDSTIATENLRNLEQYLLREGMNVMRYRCSVKPNTPNSVVIPERSTAPDSMNDFEAALPMLLGGTGSTVTSITDAVAAPTSKDVPLNMKEFTRKAFDTLQRAIAKAFNVPLLPERDQHGSISSSETTFQSLVVDSHTRTVSLESEESTANTTTNRFLETLNNFSGEPHVSAGGQPMEQKKQLSSSYFASLFVDVASFMESLCGIYVAPRGFIQQLATFACNLPNPISAKREGVDERQPKTITASNSSMILTSSALLQVVAHDGNGKSSALASLTQHLLQLKNSHTLVVYYSFQGSGASSVRAMLFFIVTTLVIRADLHSAVFIDEGAETEALLGLLPRIESELVKKNFNAVILILDAVDYCEEPAEFCRCFQIVYSSLGNVEKRIVFSATPHAEVTQALKRRFPHLVEVHVPSLNDNELAEVIRRHLASYGKRLQETGEINELDGMLRKQDSGKVSYLTIALFYLRLFSTFDTLRSDIQRLPGTTATLFPMFFKELSKRFDHETCFAVFTSLYIRHSSGGIMEYNLLRLMSNVAAAARLIALLSGTCLSSHEGCVSIRTSIFYNAIGETFFRQATSMVRTSEQMLVAELLGEPMNTKQDSMRTQNIIRSLIKSMELSTRDKDAPKCVFQPQRYSPQELLGILQTCIQAEQFDLAVTLISYLPFLEALLLDTPILQRFMSFLLQLRTSTNSVVSKAANPIYHFLLQHYHILSVRPDLLRQCVRNMPPSFNAIREKRSRVAPSGLHSAPHAAPLHQLPTGSFVTPTALTLEPSESMFSLSPVLDDIHIPGPKPCAVDTNASLSGSASQRNNFHHSDGWVRWSNQMQHGGEARQSVLSPSGRPVRLMTVSCSSLFIAFSCEDLLVQVVHSADLHQPAAGSLSHPCQVTALSFPMDSTIATGTVDGKVWIWDTESASVLRVGIFHTRPVTSLSCHPTDVLVCSSSLDTHCMVWDFSLTGSKSKLRSNLDEIIEMSGASPQKFFRPRRSPGDAARFQRPPLTPLLCLRQQDYPVSCVCYHQAGAVLGSGAWDGTVVLYNFSRMQDTLLPDGSLEDGVPFHVIKVPSPVRVLRFTPSMVVTCAVGRFDGRISLLDIASLSESACITGLHHSPLSSISFSPDGKLMASADTVGVVRVSYTGLMGTLLATFNGHRDHVTSTVFHEGPTSTLLMTSSLDQTIQVWRVDSEAAGSIPTAHSGAVTAVGCTEDGKTFVTGGDDGMAFVFTLNEDVGEFYRRCRTLCRSVHERSALTFSLYESQMIDYRNPSFALSHDGKRVCAICFGLGNTRLLTGVVTGAVYVWASEPGLDRRSGRLVYMVNAPLRGSYPIVSLECVEEFQCYKASQENPGNDERTPQVSNTARVVAVCANGEAMMLDLQSAAVSLALLQEAEKDGAAKGDTSLEASLLRKDASDTTSSWTESDSEASVERTEVTTESKKDQRLWEKVFRVYRKRLRWLKPSSAGSPSRIEMSSVLQNTKDAESDGDDDPLSTDMWEEHHKMLQSCEHESHTEQTMAYLYGEEVIGVIPVSISGNTWSSRLEVNNSGEDSSRSRGFTSHVDIQSHALLLIGRTKVFLSSVVAGSICEVPIYVEGPKVLEHLEKHNSETFTCVSRAVPYPSHDTSSGETKLSFVLNTSESSLFLCDLVAKADHSTSQPAEALKTDLIRLTARRIPHCAASSLAKPSAKVVSVDLSLVSSRNGQMTPMWEMGETSTIDHFLVLLTGCADGSSHLTRLALNHELQWTGAAPPHEMGTFFAASTLTKCVLLPAYGKGTPHTSNQRLAIKLLRSMGLLQMNEDLDEFSEPLLHWIAGDYLGNIYQLRLIQESEDGCGAIKKVPAASKPVSTVLPALKGMKELLAGGSAGPLAGMEDLLANPEEDWVKMVSQPLINFSQQAFSDTRAQNSNAPLQVIREADEPALTKSVLPSLPSLAAAPPSPYASFGQLGRVVTLPQHDRLLHRDGAEDVQ